MLKTNDFIPAKPGDHVCSRCNHAEPFRPYRRPSLQKCVQDGKSWYQIELNGSMLRFSKPISPEDIDDILAKKADPKKHDLYISGEVIKKKVAPKKGEA